MDDGRPSAATGARRPRRALWTGLAVTFALGAVVVGAWALRPGEPAASVSPGDTPTPTEAASAPMTPSAAPTPTPAGFPANTTAYDVLALPQVDVFAVIPSLPVDDDPFGSFTGEVARSLYDAAPVFADPLGEPVGALPRAYVFDGTTVPIVERQDHWVKVLLTGRQAYPSQGNPAQVTGWLRTQDVVILPIDTRVEVSISARTVDIVSTSGTERVATDFAWGTEATPTPLGRSFVMLIRTDSALWYTRGNPLVYLSVQSPTLDGFAGASVAVTAFHYHDDRSGRISNGCIRLDPGAIARLAQLALGTPVYIRA
ncbi:L,D-transpeptidase [Microbacterium ulmi]|uniref:L,D-transpeptidase family protein n=1 Tax=Microbacterium ulmi TaxID=179095 RepID=A0A7Y2Q0C0_9MICO|nr:L,D-transpeptidase [Microbacterium ulmi]NII70706.1 hypothetical protein [Microbacterium ulmi]NNH02725.1 L,D-transpeptidase family protein [Microbacterium ulmi]